MNCRQFMRFIDARALRERGEREMRDPRRHATGCSSCAEYLETAMALERGLLALAHIGPSADFSKRVMRRVTHAPTARRMPPRKHRREIVPWAVMVVGAVALIGGFLYRARPETWLKTLFSLPSGIRSGVIHQMTLQPDLATSIVAAGAVLVATAFLLLDGPSGQPEPSRPRRSGDTVVHP